ncbi:MAG: acyl-CoA thioesterase [Pseudomonadota bacterium]
MYPFIRVAREVLRARRMPRLQPGEVHVVRTRCWPWDIDPFMELNNGRTMTLMDIGRLPLAVRIGLIGVLREKGWRLTMAGAVVQYRKRVRPFAKMEIRSRMAARDERFVYMEQLTMTEGLPAHHAMYRGVVVGPDGIVPTDEVQAALPIPDWNPPMPKWARQWAEAEKSRQWPPALAEDPPQPAL